MSPTFNRKDTMEEIRTIIAITPLVSLIGGGMLWFWFQIR